MTNIDLYSTKIYELTINKKETCIEIKIVFSVNKKEEPIYKQFVQETLRFYNAMGVFVSLDDYTDYLSDECEYNLLENKVTFTTTAQSNETTILHLMPSPYGNLLRKKIQNLIQFNHPILFLDNEGLFTYYQFVDNSNTVRGIIKDLKRFYLNKPINTGTTKEYWLYNAIKALDLHWN